MILQFTHEDMMTIYQCVLMAEDTYSDCTNPDCENCGAAKADIARVRDMIEAASDSVQARVH